MKKREGGEAGMVNGVPAASPGSDFMDIRSLEMASNSIIEKLEFRGSVPDDLVIDIRFVFSPLDEHSRFRESMSRSL